MHGYIVPECYFDTVLIKTILGAKLLNHQKGCSNVINVIQRRLSDDFAVGIIDKDKHELDYLKNGCIPEITTPHLVLWKHTTKQHFFIQLAPALEKWLLQVADEAKVDFADYGFKNDLEALRVYTKSKLVGENEILKTICKRLVDSDSETMALLKTWVHYLYKENRKADINHLKSI